MRLAIMAGELSRSPPSERPCAEALNGFLRRCLFQNVTLLCGQKERLMIRDVISISMRQAMRPRATCGVKTNQGEKQCSAHS
jgi:hypothetical protein